MPHPRDRGDDSGGAARKHLGDLAGGGFLLPLVDINPAFLDRESGINSQLQQRIPCDPGQQGTGQLRGDQPRRSAAAEHEEDVHATHLFDIAAFHSVQPHHLVASVLGGFGLRQQRGGVVAAELGRTGAARTGPYILRRNPDADRGDAALEVRTGRRGDQQVTVLGGRPHAQSRLGGEDERPQIQRLLTAGTGHPSFVDSD